MESLERHTSARVKVNKAVPHGAAETTAVPAMARFDDPSVRFDAPGIFFDMPESGAAPRIKSMSKPKLNLQGVDPLSKVQLVNDIVTQMTGNANFTTPNPTLAALTTKSDALSAIISQISLTEQQLEQHNVTQDTLVTELDALLTALMAYVESASGGEEAKILSAGMGVRGKPTPPGPMPQVTGLEAKAGDDAGVILLRHDAVKGAKVYERQRSPDPFTNASWVNLDASTKASSTVTDLPSATRCWFRVRAVGAKGPGPWSDPAIKTVP